MLANVRFDKHPDSNNDAVMNPHNERTLFVSLSPQSEKTLQQVNSSYSDTLISVDVSNAKETGKYLANVLCNLWILRPGILQNMN